jgi:Amidohydrolase family
MCIGCHWANFRDYFPGASPSNGTGLTRLQALRRGAIFAASATGASSSPSFVAEAVTTTDASADIVLKNGPVYTVDGAKPWARAVAVKGKRIVFVGDEAGAQPFIGPQTRVVDLAGKMLLPGFVEGHIHPLLGATITRGADLQLATREDILGSLEAYRAKIGTADIVRGFGWRYFAFPATGPRKEDLDALWPDVPVILLAIDAHSAWVNSKALALAGVKKETKDPLPGFSTFERGSGDGRADRLSRGGPGHPSGQQRRRSFRSGLCRRFARRVASRRRRRGDDDRFRRRYADRAGGRWFHHLFETGARGKAAV